MPTFADAMKPAAKKAVRTIRKNATSRKESTKSFRRSVYACIHTPATPNSEIWGRKQLKRMKYQRRHGLMEAMPTIPR